MKVWELIANLGRMPANAEVKFSFDPEPETLGVEILNLEFVELDDNSNEPDPFVTAILRKQPHAEQPNH